MLAITFDMVVADLKEYYDKNSYNNAYYEISKVLKKYGFFRIQGSVYMTKNEDFGNLVDAIMEVSEPKWFANSVRDIRGFKVENWSTFNRLAMRNKTTKS